MPTQNSSLSLSRMIDNYNHLKIKDKASKLYINIVNQIMIMIYEIPQKYMNLEEEDASDFLLYMENKLPGIISNYNIKEADFNSYLFSILYKKIRSYKTIKYKKQVMENVILNHHSLYEFILKQEQEEDHQIEVYEKIEETQTLKKLKFLAQLSRTARKRLFIYFLSISPSFSASTIIKLCRSFCYDIDQTFDLWNKIKTIIKKLPHIDTICQKRNRQWTKFLYFQSVNNTSTEEDFREFFYKYNLDATNKILSGQECHASRKQMSLILGITEGTAGAAIHCISKIIRLCNGDEPFVQSSDYYGISIKLIRQIVNGHWETLQSTFKNTVFFPFKEFKINKLVEHKQ